MKLLFHLSVVVCLTIVFLTATSTSTAGLNSNHYGLIINDCMGKSNNSVCPALRDYLETKANGRCLKTSACISHLKDKGIKDSLATYVCRWYFNDRQ